MPVKIAINLDTVERIEFIFKQKVHYKTFTYPSEFVKRSTSVPDALNILWSAEDAWEFAPGKVGLDTKIFLKNSVYNPETKIVMIDLHDTLFEEVPE